MLKVYVAVGCVLRNWTVCPLTAQLVADVLELASNPSHGNVGSFAEISPIGGGLNRETWPTPTWVMAAREMREVMKRIFV